MATWRATMDINTLDILENKIIIPHHNFDIVFKEILSVTQHGRKDEIVTVIGPAGIGKTTMLKYLFTYLCNQQAAGWRDDCHPPIIVEAPSAIKGDFPWKSFLTEILDKLGEKNINRKLNMEDAQKRKQQGRGSSTCSKPSVSELEDLMRTRIRYFRPIVIFIDEGQNIVDKIIERDKILNLNRLKNWANTMNTKFIVFGTHEAKELLNLNEQLSRRVVPVYFPRYQRDSETELKNFAQFFLSLKEHLDIKIDPKSYENFYDIYDYSLGCPGLLVSWLHRAIATCITHNNPQITSTILKSTRYSKVALTTTEKAIKNFERYYQQSLESFNPNEVFADPEDPYQPDLLRNSAAPKVIKRNLKPGQQHPRYHKVHENRFE